MRSHLLAMVYMPCHYLVCGRDLLKPFLHKGDHRHLGGREEPYIFSDPRQLTADFFDEIKRWQHEHSHD